MAERAATKAVPRHKRLPTARPERPRTDRRRRARRRPDHRIWTATDDLPVRIPVTLGEIDAIETFLGALLDELLAEPPEA